MLRIMMIALFASASVAMLAPDAASARGGFGGGGGGFHGGGGGGFRGGVAALVVVVSAAAEWEWAAVASVRPQSAAVVSAVQRSAAAVSVLLRSVAPVSVRWHLHRAGIRGGNFAGNWRGGNWRGGFHNGFRHRRFPIVAVGFGLGYGSYGYYDDYIRLCYDMPITTATAAATSCGGAC